MARPREFDTTTALNGAMNEFWTKGYDGASLPDLLEGMGITRGSLYKAFTDKKTLFLPTLRIRQQRADRFRGIVGRRRRSRLLNQFRQNRLHSPSPFAKLRKAILSTLPAAVSGIASST